MKPQAAVRKKSVIEGDDTEGITHTYCKQKQNVTGIHAFGMQAMETRYAHPVWGGGDAD